jgi:hypothetical protein
VVDGGHQVTLQAACSRLASVDEFKASDCGCSCTLSNTDIENVLDDASDLIYTLSGGTIFGQCSGTVRPCRTCWCGHCVCCCEIEAIPLRQDALSITEVTIDGDVLDPANYTLLSRGRLQKISIDGNRPEPWPCCQSLYRGLDEEDTFGITYTFGQEHVPQWAKNAVIELACDMATFFSDGRGKLPPGATAVTYQNVTATLPSRADALRDGTALSVFPAVSQLLALVGPTARSQAFSPSGATAWSFL